MKPRKTKDLIKTLKRKSFSLYPEKNHHNFYCLTINGKKHNVYTYFSHGKKEYNKSLMGKIKKQLKFDNANDAERYFDCPMSKEEYIDLLVDKGIITL